MGKSYQSIVDDPGCSYFLRESIKKLSARDPVDALRDAEILMEFCKTRLNQL